MKTNRIIFVLPAITKKIVGGYKMVYTYANYLSENGYAVCIFYDCNRGKNSKNIPGFICVLVRKILCILEPTWYKLNETIQKKSIYNINKKYFCNDDIIFATSVYTSIKLKEINNVYKKLYFIQDFENWSLEDRYVKETYSFGFINIVVSKWLKKIVEENSKTDAIYIPNGVDDSKFKIMTPIDERPKLSVAMLYHTNERKNSKMGLKILKTLKEKYPELNADLFGSIPRPEFLPSWINYIEKASEKEVVQIYNRNTFFLCTSSVEGYGLTGLESLFCGCCLISTNCLGVEEYAKNGFNCLLSEPKDEEAMLKNIVIAIENDNLRRQLTKNSKELINNYKLDKSKQLFAELIKEVIR